MVYHKTSGQMLLHSHFFSQLYSPISINCHVPSKTSNSFILLRLTTWRMLTLYNITVIFSFYNPTADIHITGMLEFNVSAARNPADLRSLWILVPVFIIIKEFLHPSRRLLYCPVPTARSPYHLTLVWCKVKSVWPARSTKSRQAPFF